MKRLFFAGLAFCVVAGGIASLWATPTSNTHQHSIPRVDFPGLPHLTSEQNESIRCTIGLLEDVRLGEDQYLSANQMTVDQALAHAAMRITDRDEDITCRRTAMSCFSAIANGETATAGQRNAIADALVTVMNDVADHPRARLRARNAAEEGGLMDLAAVASAALGVDSDPVVNAWREAVVAGRGQ